jgi:hypothetical protein
LIQKKISMRSKKKINFDSNETFVSNIILCGKIFYECRLSKSFCNNCKKFVTMIHKHSRRQSFLDDKKNGITLWTNSAEYSKFRRLSKFRGNWQVCWKLSSVQILTDKISYSIRTTLCRLGLRSNGMRSLNLSNLTASPMFPRAVIASCFSKTSHDKFSKT